MGLPAVLATVANNSKDGAIVEVNLHNGTFKVLFPYFAGGLCAAADQLYVGSSLSADHDRTRIEKHDRQGLVWMRRIDRCFDVHSLVQFGDQLAVCSTGTNEVIVLDRHGAEVRRWSPDPQAEQDSWHLNTLFCHEDRLFLTCFGRFSQFRGWSGKTPGAGLLLDVHSGRAVVTNLTSPHDPVRIEGGWLINEGFKTQTTLYPDRGSPQVIAKLNGFARGLAVLPDVYAIGYSSKRHAEQQVGTGGVVLVERSSRRIIKTLPLPYLEVGHIVPAPSPEVLAAINREQKAGQYCFTPPIGAIAEADRIGSLTANGHLTPCDAAGELFEISVHLKNDGQAVWSSASDMPVHVALQILNEDGKLVFPEGGRFGLPLPIVPGKSLTFRAVFRLDHYRQIARAAAIRLTLVQEGVAWWEKTGTWTPAIVPLPFASQRARLHIARELPIKRAA